MSPANSLKREQGRGRQAESPRQIPRPGWRDILLRVKSDLTRKNLSMIAAGVAFYAFFAIFPALVAMVSLFGIFSDPQQVRDYTSVLAGVLPQEGYRLIDEQLTRIASTSGGALTFGFFGGIAVALWSAAKGVKALMEALNITYGEEESRGMLRYNGLALLLTLVAIAFFLLAAGLVIFFPALIGFFGLPGFLETTFSLLRWPLLIVCVMLALAVLYRYAPDRRQPHWRWVSPGAVIATLLWIIVSALFSYYVSNFGDYNATYGALGAVVILLFWFWLTAFIVIIGAEFDAEMEHQTERDSTVPGQRPMGKREAHVADTVGKKP